MRLDLSICVASYNTKEATLRTLRSVIADSAGIDAEVIVVDNASGDGSAELIRDSFPDIDLIENTENRLFSASYNQAFEASSGRYLLAINSDVEILGGAMSAMIGFLEANPGVGAVTGRMHSPDGRLQRTGARFATFGYLALEYGLPGFLMQGARAAHRRERGYHDWDRMTPMCIDVAPGSFLMMRRDLLQQIGGFDELLRLYFSDDDWCLRAARVGSRICYLPSAQAIHMEGTSSSKIPGRARLLFFRDLLTYTRKHFGPVPSWAMAVMAWPTLFGMNLAAKVRSAGWMAS
jgi:GT2 family glycosyltransferase